jgi:hypothetical protein
MDGRATNMGKVPEAIGFVWDRNDSASGPPSIDAYWKVISWRVNSVHVQSQCIFKYGELFSGRKDGILHPQGADWNPQEFNIHVQKIPVLALSMDKRRKKIGTTRSEMGTCGGQMRQQVRQLVGRRE